MGSEVLLAKALEHKTQKPSGSSTRLLFFVFFLKFCLKFTKVLKIQIFSDWEGGMEKVENGTKSPLCGPPPPGYSASQMGAVSKTYVFGADKIDAKTQYSKSMPCVGMA
ncbi:hypothetical protein V5T82_05335 [Magnetovibrio sp. PR-2]|uniref:hypothetical protein n=1 Tax=Magnetovibrio sp. PR-2 TaxID=3120356 RepID=UPI002FCE2163